MGEAAMLSAPGAMQQAAAAQMAGRTLPPPTGVHMGMGGTPMANPMAGIHMGTKNRELGQLPVQPGPAIGPGMDMKGPLAQFALGMAGQQLSQQPQQGMPPPQHFMGLPQGAAQPLSAPPLYQASPMRF